MNVVFSVICVISLAIFCLTSPENALPAMLNGANKALSLIFTLVPVYAVWMGLYRILELSGITGFISKLIKRPIALLFGKTSDKAAEYISLNISANMLGLGGAATPAGINACLTLENEGNETAKQLLLVIASTSVQILPLSVIALMVSYGSKNYPSIILPGFLSTLFSTVLGITSFKLLSKITQNHKNVFKKPQRKSKVISTK